MDSPAYFIDPADGAINPFATPTTTAAYYASSAAWAQAQDSNAAQYPAYFALSAYDVKPDPDDNGHGNGASTASLQDALTSSRRECTSNKSTRTSRSGRSSISSRASKSSKSTPPRSEPPKSQASGRKKPRKSKQAAMVVADERDEEEDDSVVEDSKRTKVLERNRVAATKCRQKKKEWMSDLEDTKQDLETRHKLLRMEYDGLVGEVSRIKDHLMSHATCNDTNIDKWLVKEARKFVNGPERGSRNLRDAAGDFEDGPQAYIDQSWPYADILSPTQSSPTTSNASRMPSRSSGHGIELNFNHMPNSMFSVDHSFDTVG